VTFGAAPNAGGVVSTTATVTVKLPLDVLPAASVAVQLTVVGPAENVLPDAGEQETTGLAVTASVAVAAG